jgi:hypothetical protein
VNADLARIGRDFPGWHPWRSDEGRWWATRTGNAAADYRNPAWMMTLDSDDADGLRSALARQEALRWSASPVTGQTGPI